MKPAVVIRSENEELPGFGVEAGKMVCDTQGALGYENGAIVIARPEDGRAA